MKRKVRMTRTVKASPDGVTINVYEKGIEIEVPEELFRIFVKEGWAKPVGNVKAKTEPKKEGKGKAGKNK